MKTTTLKTIHTEIASMNRHFSERLSEMIRSFAVVHVRIDDLGKRVDAGFDRVDERINQSDERFVSLKAEIIDGIPCVLGPYTTEIERMLDNHERRILALESERRPPGNA